MSRITAREIAIHIIFELDFSGRSAADVLSERLSEELFDSLSGEYKLYARFPGKDDLDYIDRVVSGVYEHIPELDSYIEKYSVGWKFSRISRISACIMRVTMFEILYLPDVPPRSAINAAVELVKAYESREAAAFVNGLLGSFIRAEGFAIPEQDPAPPEPSDGEARSAEPFSGSEGADANE